MMISPDTYYEFYLKGKTAKEILTNIKGLRSEIGRLLKSGEYSIDSIKCCMHPSIEVQISYTDEFLERAKEALTELGETYSPTRTELKKESFNNNLAFVKEIIFNCGSCFEPQKYYVFCNDNPPTLKIGNKWRNTYLPIILPDTKLKSFLDDFEALNIWRWKRNYMAFDVLDGEQWELQIVYNNPSIKTLTYSGSNAYPYNFLRLKELFTDNNNEEGE